MSNTLKFYGASDDLVEFEGFITDEFPVDNVDEWRGELAAPDGTIVGLFAAYCGEQNPDGWHIEVTDEYGECPWPVERGTFPPRYDDEETGDPYIELTVPPGTMLNPTTWED